MALTWNPVTFANGAYGAVSYSADTPTGAGAATVRLRGSMHARPGATAFTLGAGARPGAVISLAAIDPRSLRPLVVTVDTAGNVSVTSPYNNRSGSEMIFVALDNLSFAGEA